MVNDRREKKQLGRIVNSPLELQRWIFRRGFGKVRHIRSTRNDILIFREDLQRDARERAGWNVPRVWRAFQVKRGTETCVCRYVRSGWKLQSGRLTNESAATRSFTVRVKENAQTRNLFRSLHAERERERESWVVFIHFHHARSLPKIIK